MKTIGVGPRIIVLIQSYNIKKYTKIELRSPFLARITRMARILGIGYLSSGYLSVQITAAGASRRRCTVKFVESVFFCFLARIKGLIICAAGR